MIQNRGSRRTTMVMGLLVLAGICQVAWAGDLEPPGAPSPTTTAINETDPRSPIRSGDLPLNISAPGSYYLAEDISTAGFGITISADNVTIDLMGFSLRGGTGNGISATDRKNLAVKNGSVSGWSASGISLADGSNSIVSNVRAEGNGIYGIRVGEHGLVINSTAQNNLGTGIFGEDGSTIIGCNAAFNLVGISAGFGSTVTNCSAMYNSADGITATAATVSYSTATFNGDDGISVTAGGAVLNCTARSNDGDGIVVLSGTSVVGNTCNSNGQAGGGAGIHVIQNYNRIEANNVTFNNGPGFDVDMGGNIIIKNTARGNLQNYAQIVGGNAVGLVQAVSSNFTNTNAWANFSY